MTREEKIIERYKARIGNRQLLAIRAFCVECFGGQPMAVKDCPSRSCALYPFRMGEGNPDELTWVAAKHKPNPERGTWEPKAQPIAVLSPSQKHQKVA